MPTTLRMTGGTKMAGCMNISISTSHSPGVVVADTVTLGQACMRAWRALCQHGRWQVRPRLVRVRGVRWPYLHETLQRSTAPPAVHAGTRGLSWRTLHAPRPEPPHHGAALQLSANLQRRGVLCLVENKVHVPFQCQKVPLENLGAARWARELRMRAAGWRAVRRGGGIACSHAHAGAARVYAHCCCRRRQKYVLGLWPPQFASQQASIRRDSVVRTWCRVL